MQNTWYANWWWAWRQVRRGGKECVRCFFSLCNALSFVKVLYTLPHLHFSKVPFSVCFVVLHGRGLPQIRLMLTTGRWGAWKLCVSRSKLPGDRLPCFSTGSSYECVQVFLGRHLLQRSPLPATQSHMAAWEKWDWALPCVDFHSTPHFQWPSAMPCAWIHSYSGSAAAGFHPGKGKDACRSAPHSNFILVLQFLRLPGVHWQEWSLFLMASPQHIGSSLLWLVKSVTATPSILRLCNFVELLFTATSSPILSLFFILIFTYLF